MLYEMGKFCELLYKWDISNNKTIVIIIKDTSLAFQLILLTNIYSIKQEIFSTHSRLH